jgi:HEAT repeat protein
MLEQAFEALKTYDWGVDPKVLAPIDEAVITTRGNDETRAVLEKQLVEVLNSEVSRDAKDFVCRKLMYMGGAACVPALAGLLSQAELSHMARYALERIPAPAAAQALRDSLPKVSGELKVGVISSLGDRQDADSVEMLGGMLGDADAAVARAAALALGSIRTPAAAKAIAGAKTVNSDAKPAVTDASLACAEALLADGAKADALLIYKKIGSEDQPKYVRLAATRGMLACAGK